MINDQNIQRLKQKIIRDSETIYQFLRDMVLTESPSRVPETFNRIFHQIGEHFGNIGFRQIHMPGKETAGYLVARPRRKKKNQPVQLLIGHIDTVWPLGTLNEMPLKEEGEVMKGPGVYDMKAGITQIVFALKTIYELGIEPEVLPVVLINTDEEIGSQESTHAIERLAKIAGRAYVMEPPLGFEGKLKTRRKGIGRFTITVKGKAAHAGLDPGKGVNAIVELSNQVQQLFAMNNPERGITVNIGMIEGGISANVVAPESRATIDVRVLTKEDLDEVSNQIYNLKPTMEGVKVIVEGEFGRLPMEETPCNQKLWNIAQSAARQIGLELDSGTAGGASDGNTTSQYTATLDGLGTMGDGAHALHEHIIKEKLVERTLLLSLLILAKPVKI